MRIYTDASAIVSLYDWHDPNHTKAENISKKYLEDDYITSAYSFAEIVTILSQRVDKKTAIAVGNHIKQTYIWVEVNKDVEDLAWEIFKKQKSKNVSFVDCAIFALHKLGLLDKVFTFDKDFKKNKIPILE